LKEHCDFVDLSFANAKSYHVFIALKLNYAVCGYEGSFLRFLGNVAKDRFIRELGANVLGTERLFYSCDEKLGAEI